MLFKILHGDASRISTDVTPYHEGYCYVTHDGYFYVDMNNERVKLNADEASKLVGYDISTVLNDSDSEMPTSRAVLNELSAKVDKVDGMGLSSNDFTTEEKTKLANIDDQIAHAVAAKSQIQIITWEADD